MSTFPTVLQVSAVLHLKTQKYTIAHQIGRTACYILTMRLLRQKQASPALIQLKRELKSEYENLNDYLYAPYEKMGDNGSAKRVIEEVRRLPIRKGEPA